jgi:hypothetical protein
MGKGVSLKMIPDLKMLLKFITRKYVAKLGMVVGNHCIGVPVTAYEMRFLRI